MNSEGIFKCAFGSCKYHTYIINDIHVKIKYINDNNRMLFEYLYNMIEDNNLKIMDMLYDEFNTGVHFVVTTDEFKEFERNVLNKDQCWVVENENNEKRTIDGRWYPENINFVEYIEPYIPCIPPPPAYNAPPGYNARNVVPGYNSRNAPPPYRTGGKTRKTRSRKTRKSRGRKTRKTRSRKK